MISDYFPPHQRGRALSIYSLGIPIGLAAGALLGGILAAHVDWRWAFIVVGLAGVVIAPIFRLVVREPARGAFDPVAAERTSVWTVFGILPPSRVSGC